GTRGRFPRLAADEIPGSCGALESEVFRQVRLAPRAIFRHGGECPPRRVIQHRLVDAVETVFDARRQRTRHLPAALLAERLVSLLVGLSHPQKLISSAAVVKPVMPRQNWQLNHRAV